MVGAQYVGVVIWVLPYKKVLQLIKHVLCQAVPGIGYPEMNDLAPPFDKPTVQGEIVVGR